MGKLRHKTLAVSALVCGMFAAGAADASADYAGIQNGSPALTPTVTPAGGISARNPESTISLDNTVRIPDMLRAPFREAASGAPIVDQPEGVCEDYVRESVSYWSMFGTVFTVYDRGSIAKIVKGEENTVYYYSPFGMQAVKSWIKGTVDESGVMTFSLPQPVMTVGSYEYFASAMEIVDGAYRLAEVQEYKLKYDGKNITAVTPEMVLALTTWADKDKTTLGWSGYGDQEPLLVPLTEVLPEPPASLAAEEWGLLAGSKTGFVNVGIDGSDIWIQGLSSETPDSWIKGKISGNSIEIPSAQYMGPNIPTGHYEYMQACRIDSVLNPSFDIWDETPVQKEALEMSYDSGIQLARSLPNNNIFFTTTAGPGSDGNFTYATILREPLLKKQDRNAATPPMAPTLVEYAPFDETYGYGSVKFKFPPYDIEYNNIDTADLYYELWVNGKPFVFYPDEYDTLTEEMELVPYNYTDNYWFEKSGLNRTVYFFFDGASSMGLKTVYKTDEATVYSDYTPVVGDPTIAVEDIEGDAFTVAEEYFDLQGRRISGDAKGIRIVRKTMSDGKVRAVKSVKH